MDRLLYNNFIKFNVHFDSKVEYPRPSGCGFAVSNSYLTEVSILRIHYLYSFAIWLLSINNYMICTLLRVLS